MTDAEILHGLQNNVLKRQLYENSLYSRFHYFIEEGKRKYSLTHEDAFTSYTDAVIKTIENIYNGAFEGRSSLKTYIYQIFHNKCVDQVRKNATNKSEVNKAVGLTETLNNISDTAKTILQQLADKADIDLLKRQLNEIGNNCRQMLMFSADGYSDREIAEMMGFKTSAVAKTSRLRCLEKLRILYKDKT